MTASPGMGRQATVVHVMRRFGQVSETFITDLIHDLDEAGWRAQVVAMEIDNRDRFPFPPDGRLALARPPRRARGVVDRLRLRTSAERRSARLIRPMAEAGGQLVHGHFGWAAADARLAAARLGLPLIASFHGSDLMAPRGRGRDRDYARLAAGLDHAITVSRFLSSRLRDLGYAGPIDVIPGGVRLGEFRFRGPRPEGGPARLLFVGRQVECKGLDVLLNALASVRSRRSEIELEIVGEGPARERNELLADRLGLRGIVTFRGAVPKADVLEALLRSDMLVVPSRTAAGRAEGRSVVAMEGLAIGLPVVATDNGGLPETIPPRYRHEIVPEGDPAALAARMLALLAARSEWPERARIGREWAEREFDSTLLAQKVGRIYAEVLERRTPAAERKYGAAALVG